MMMIPIILIPHIDRWLYLDYCMTMMMVLVFFCRLWCVVLLPDDDADDEVSMLTLSQCLWKMILCCIMVASNEY